MEHRQNENHAGYAENIGLDAYQITTSLQDVPAPDNIDPDCDKKWPLPDIFFISHGVNGSCKGLCYDVELSGTGFARGFVPKYRPRPCQHFLFDRDACVYFDQCSVTTQSNASDYGIMAIKHLYILSTKAERWLIQMVMRTMY